MSGYLIFGGIDSRDYDVFVSFSDIDTVPRRVYTKVDIVGKNGAVLIDEGKYEDVPHSYDCIVLDNEKRVAFVNAIMSKKGYQRLTDSYGTDEYYTAVLEENIEQKTTRIRDKYKFKLVFTRKPQRFLMSGEEPVDTSELGGEVTTDKIPYLLRRSGGGNIGHDFDAEIDKLVGGTVAWNQLADVNDGTVSRNGVTASYSNNIVTLTGTASPQALLPICNSNTKIIQGHKYLLRGNLQNTSYDTGALYMTNSGAYAWDYGNGRIFTANESSNAKSITIMIPNGVDATGMKFCPQLTDLTALFGSAEIADYIYSLEQTTAGAGIAWLKAHGFLTKDYYAYDSGSLKSVKTSEHRTVGLNQWDEEWEVGAIDVQTGGNISATTRIRSKNYIRVLPNTTYCVTCPSNVSMRYYDEDKNYIGAYDKNNTGDVYPTTPTRVTPSNCGYIRFETWNEYGTTYKNDICINISDPSKNGQYEPYNAHTYPLDSDLELRGIPKLDNGSLYYDGDVYESSGAVTRKYGIVDLGTLNWRYESGWNAFVTTINDAKRVTRIAFAICPLYISVGGHFSGDSSPDMTMAINTNAHAKGTCTFRNTAYGTDVAAFKTAMSGVYLVYELATPTTEQADPYANPQVVSPLGTEEYVDTRDVPIPVGHETKYGMSQLILTNPTAFPSKPLLEVTGVGTFWLGDTQFTITGTEGQTIYIDCETGEAWKNVGGIITPANGLVTLNRLDFPELDSGTNNIQLGSGISKVKITPRWWRL